MLCTSVKLLPSSLFTCLPIYQSTYRSYGLSKGPHLFTEVKSYWAGLISGWVTILVSLCCLPWEVRLALCSTSAPPTSATVRGLSFSLSQPDLMVFLRVPRFSSRSKMDSQVKKKNGLGAVLRDHDTWPFGGSHWGAFHMHSADPVELHPSQLSLRAASKGD